MSQATVRKPNVLYTLLAIAAALPAVAATSLRASTSPAAVPSTDGMSDSDIGWIAGGAALALTIGGGLAIAIRSCCKKKATPPAELGMSLMEP